MYASESRRLNVADSGEGCEEVPALAQRARLSASVEKISPSSDSREKAGLSVAFSRCFSMFIHSHSSS